MIPKDLTINLFLNKRTQFVRSTLYYRTRQNFCCETKFLKDFTSRRESLVCLETEYHLQWASFRSHRIQQSLYLTYICVMEPKSVPCYRHTEFQRWKTEVRKRFFFCLFNKSLFPDIPTYTVWSRCIIVFSIINQNWEYTFQPHYWLDLERWRFNTLISIRLWDPAAEHNGPG